MDGGWGGGWEDEAERSHSSSDGAPPPAPELKEKRRKEVERRGRVGVRWREGRRDRIACISGVLVATGGGEEGFRLALLVLFRESLYSEQGARLKLQCSLTTAQITCNSGTNLDVGS